MKLRTRMLVVILSSITLILAGLISYTASSSRTSALNAADSLALASGEKISGAVQLQLESAMNAARTLADTLYGLKAAGLPNRDAANAMLKKVLEDNPAFLGTWTAWEPNAFDGKDSRYRNADGTDESGRYIPYWTRGDGASIGMTALVDYDKPGAGDYYLLAKQSGQETILDPFTYDVGGKSVLMTSFVVPIKENDAVIGVAGVDITLEQLQSIMDDFKLYGTGYAQIYSHNGSLVTSPQAGQLGKKLTEVSSHPKLAERMAQTIDDGKPFQSSEYGLYQLLTPLKIGRTADPWSVGITIPLSEVTAASSNQLISSITAGVLALILLAIVIWVITNSLLKPISASVAIGEIMSEGDFTKEIPLVYLKRKDEIGTLVRVFDTIARKMREMLGQVSLNAGQVAAASRQISVSAEEMAGASQTQAESSQTINELFRELSLAVHSVAKGAEEAAELSDQTNRIASEGGLVVRQSMEGMQDVNVQMSKLQADSARIGDIIEVIDDIAEQTNLLALNAAIEAARAGEQGRGFAVVADEVRKLAERSGEATKQITDIIRGMQENTQLSVKAANDGVSFAKQTEEAFRSIITKVDEAARQVTEIAAASEQQAAQASEVQVSIETISAAAEEAAAGSEQTAATAQSLASLAQELNEGVLRFKI